MYEKANPSHPDKISDRIAGALVDLAYSMEENPKIAVEVLLGHGACHIIAETSVALDRIRVVETTSLPVYGFKVGLFGLFVFSLDLRECRWYCVLLTELHFRRILLHFRRNRDFSRKYQYNYVRKDDEQ